MDEGVTGPEAMTVSQYIARVNKVLRDQVGETWVRGEISNFKVWHSGHVYFDLVETTKKGTASLSAAIFSDEWHDLCVTFEERNLDLKLALSQKDVEVVVQGRADIWAKTGKFSLKVFGIDPNFMEGVIGANRDKVRRRLQSEGIYDLNKGRHVPAAPLNVALVTSFDSAAYHDVLSELRSSGLAFNVRFYRSSVEGNQALADLPARIREAGRDPVADLLMVVRGGGAKNALAMFDEYEVAKAICESKLPVYVGIGHEIDSSIADEVAHSDFKTPTACAASVVNLVRSSLDRAEGAWSDIAALGLERLNDEQRHLSTVATKVKSSVNESLSDASARLAVTASRLKMRPSAIIGIAERSMSHRADRLRLLDPRTTMARGWSIVRDASGRTVRSIGQVSAGDAITVQVADGEVAATVGGARTSASGD